MKCPHTSHVEGDQFVKTLLRHGCQRHSFWNSQPDSQMYTFPDQMNWQLMDSKFQSKLQVLDTDHIKQKTSLFSVQGKSAWYCFMVVVLLFYVISVHKINARTPITIIQATHLLHESILNVKYRMDWSYRKPNICLSFNFWKQYFANGTCLTSVEYAEICHLPLTSLKESNFAWLILKFPDLLNCPLWVKRINFPGIVTDVTQILWGDPKYRCSFRILNRIENRRQAVAGFQCHAIQNRSKWKSNPFNR